jgi:hypothetical protein
MKYTMDDLHRMNPAAVISYEGHRPMQVIEVIQHICHSVWDRLPDPTSETASHQEPQA